MLITKKIFKLKNIYINNNKLIKLFKIKNIFKIIIYFL